MFAQLFFKNLQFFIQLCLALVVARSEHRDLTLYDAIQLKGREQPRERSGRIFDVGNQLLPEFTDHRCNLRVVLKVGVGQITSGIAQFKHIQIVGKTWGNF